MTRLLHLAKHTQASSSTARRPSYSATMTPHPFRTAVEAKDLDGMVAVMRPDVRLHSPVAFRPFVGTAQVRELFGHLLEVFEDFHYTDELAADCSHALVFEARLGPLELQGLDHLAFDDDGLVREFTVMVRPLSAAIRLAEVMAPRVGHLKD